MSRGIDLSGLSPAERLVAGSGAALFLNGFVPWWYRIRTPGKTYLHNAGLTGWGLAAVLLGFAATTAVLVRSTRRPTMSPRDFVLYLALGVGVLVALAAEAQGSRVTWIGSWVAVSTGVAIVVGGLKRRRERRAGWR